MDTIDQLLRSELGVHAELRGGIEITAGIGENVLRWLARTIVPGMRTAEVGCGLSTIVFALKRANHLCVSPFIDEHQRVAAWCRAHDIPITGVEFVADRSDSVLPALDLSDLDLALIDGSHAFPHAFIDYWYLALALRIGGVMIVDDVQIWTGLVLRDFLVEQPGWELACDWGKTVVFRKTAPIDEMGAWTPQPYVFSRSIPLGIPGLKGYFILLRHGKIKWALVRARGLVDRRLRRSRRRPRSSII